MKTLTKTINIKIDYLNKTINELIYDEAKLILNELNLMFVHNNTKNIDTHIEKLTNLMNLKSSLSSHLIPYSNKKNDKELDEFEEAVPTFGSMDDDSPVQDEENNNQTPEIPEDNFYFFNFDKNYGEYDNSISLNYKIKPLEEFKLFQLKISGLKLYDNVFLSRTLRECSIKMMSFLFILNEKPFIDICKTKSSYFSSSSEKLRKPITLKENTCYIESDLSEEDAHEMIIYFLNYVDIELSACKVLLSGSIGKDNQNYVTVVL